MREWRPMTMPDRPVLLYDDGCRFCRAMAEVLLRLSRRSELAVLPWGHDQGREWLAGLEPSVRDASMHLKLPDGRLVSGNRVLEATLRHVRSLRWVAALARRSRLVRRMLGSGYGWAAKHRELLSRCVPNRRPVMREPGLR